MLDHRGSVGSDNLHPIRNDHEDTQQVHITSLQIKNFQSLQDVSLDLEPFTVIVGPSSSGKSALTRAIKTLIHNRRGSEFITHNTNRCTITAELVSGHRVTLSRTPTAGANNFYEVTPPPSSSSLQQEPVKYTKLGGEVPEQVSQVLNIWPTDTLTFAGQFDKPYLLDDSPAQAARALGSLTNVHVIFEAARESNRVKLATSQTLKTRQQDLLDAQETLQKFSGITERREKINAAQESVERAKSLTSRRDTLKILLEKWLQAQVIVDKTVVPDSLALDTGRAEELQIKVQSAHILLSKIMKCAQELQRAKSALVAIPDTEKAEQLQVRLSDARSILDRLSSTAKTYQGAREALGSLDGDVTALEDHYHQLLADAGNCPTCGQSTV